MKRFTGLAIVSLMALCVSASAAPTMRPGLWSVTSTADMGAMMPKLSPQQIAMLQKMHAKIPGQSKDGITTQMCVTLKQSADMANFARDAQKKMGCKPENVRSMGNTSSADIVCDGQMKGRGHSTMTYYGDSKYVSDYAFKGTSRGRVVDMKTHGVGTFVSKDCGNVQSFGAK
jgi:hypothetical protein